MSGPFRALFFASVVLLPWAWFPPFPWLHPHAQWSDATFALACIAWLADRRRDGDWPRAGRVHAAMLAYVAWAAVSYAAAGDHTVPGAAKLLGIAELAVMAVVTADVARRAGGTALIADALSATAILSAAAAIAAVVGYYAGVSTPLLADLGDLDPGSYPRVRAGMGLPNLLASVMIVATGVLSRPEAATSPRLRRLGLASAAMSAALSLSRGVLGVALALLVSRTQGPRQRRIAMAFGVAAALAVSGLTVWNVGFDPTRPWRLHLRDEPSSRLLAVRSAATSLQERPWFGVGPGNLPGMRGGVPCDAHLTPLNVAATLGAPALLAFVAIPLLLWVDRRRPANPGVWGALAGLGIDGLGQDIEDFRHLWLAFGLALFSPDNDGSKEPGSR